MNTKEKSKVEEKKRAKEALKALEELEKLDELDNIVKGDTIEFEVDKKVYRISKLNQAQNKELADYRRKTYMELIEDDSYLFRKEWIERYKKRGIDIHQMDVQMKTLQSQLEATLLKLATLDAKPTVDSLKEEIVRLRNKQYDISIEKTSLLSYSIEDQLFIKSGTFSTYLVLEERLEDGTWKKLFNTYEDFENSDIEKVTNTAIYYMGFLSIPRDLTEKE